jgi:hypothetical protein
LRDYDSVCLIRNPPVTRKHRGRGDFRWKGNKLPRTKKMILILFKELDVYREAIQKYHDTNTRNYPENAEIIPESTGDNGNALRPPHIQIAG